MERRYRLIAPSGAKNILTYNKKYPDKALTHWLLVIDELATLMEHPKHKKEALLRLSELARKGRASGIYLVFATQNPESHIVPGQISANMDARLAFRTGSGTASGVLLGDGKYDAARLPPVPGRVIWKWGTETVQVQTPFLAESAMAGIVRDIKAGKIVDAREAELKQKADHVFKQSLALCGGECHSKNLYQFLKPDGFKKSEVVSILDKYEVTETPAGLGPEIVIDNTPYYLCPAIVPKRIARHLVPVADVLAGQHPVPNYDYSMTKLATRYPLPKNQANTIRPDNENPDEKMANVEIDELGNLAPEPGSNAPTEPEQPAPTGQIDDLPTEPEPETTNEPDEDLELSADGVELSVWDAYSDDPETDEDLPDWLNN
jgi:hypothetical protein